jgi:inorganic pyrophosphatase
MFGMRDEAGGDDKLICVPAHDPRLENLRDLHHLPEFHRLETQHFFEIYKELEPGKSGEGVAGVGRAAAEAELETSGDGGGSPAHEHRAGQVQTAR